MRVEGTVQHVGTSTTLPSGGSLADQRREEPLSRLALRRAGRPAAVGPRVHRWGAVLTSGSAVQVPPRAQPAYRSHEPAGHGTAIIVEVPIRPSSADGNGDRPLAAGGAGDLRPRQDCPRSPDHRLRWPTHSYNQEIQQEAWMAIPGIEGGRSRSMVPPRFVALSGAASVALTVIGVGLTDHGGKGLSPDNGARRRRAVPQPRVGSTPVRAASSGATVSDDGRGGGHHRLLGPPLLDMHVPRGGTEHLTVTGVTDGE